jgi:hypothetical protein
MFRGLNCLNPVSNPPLDEQGSVRLLCVNVWFKARKSKATILPMEAFNEEGENASSPRPPTVTTKVELTLLVKFFEVEVCPVGKVRFQAHGRCEGWSPAVSRLGIEPSTTTPKARKMKMKI